MYCRNVPRFSPCHRLILTITRQRTSTTHHYKTLSIRLMFAHIYLRLDGDWCTNREFQPASTPSIISCAHHQFYNLYLYDIMEYSIRVDLLEKVTSMMITHHLYKKVTLTVSKSQYALKLRNIQAVYRKRCYHPKRYIGVAEHKS